MKTVVVTAYRWDAQLQRSVPVKSEVVETESSDSVFTMDEIAAILKAVLSIK